MLKKISIVLLSLLVLLALLAGIFLYSNDTINVQLSKIPADGIVESNYLIRTEADGKAVLNYSLVTTHGLKSNRVIISEGSAQGNDGVFVKWAGGITSINDDETVAVVEGSAFHNGSIEVEVNGSVSPKASRLFKLFARGFIGVCFRISDDVRTFECIYLRPENGITDDNKRQMHAVQYISKPDWDFSRLREEAPEQYENPAPIAPGKWHKMRIDVSGQSAKLFIDDGKNPVLEINDLKLGSDATGNIGLWVGPGTNGFFKNLKITKSD